MSLSLVNDHYKVIKCDKNFQLLDEMLDNGFPLATELNILQELIKPPNFLRTIANQVHFKLTPFRHFLGGGGFNVVKFMIICECLAPLCHFFLLPTFFPLCCLCRCSSNIRPHEFDLLDVLNVEVITEAEDCLFMCAFMSTVET